MVQNSLHFKEHSFLKLTNKKMHFVPNSPFWAFCIFERHAHGRSAHLVCIVDHALLHSCRGMCCRLEEAGGGTQRHPLQPGIPKEAVRTVFLLFFFTSPAYPPHDATWKMMTSDAQLDIKNVATSKRMRFLLPCTPCVTPV